MIAGAMDTVALLGVLDDVLGMQLDEVGRHEDGRPLWRWQWVVAGHRHASLEAWHTPAAALRAALAARFGLLGEDSPTPAS